MAGVKAIERPCGLHRGDHLCWSYDETRPFGEAAAEFIQEGVALGERALYTAHGTAAELTDQLAGLPGRDALLSSGQLVVRSLTDVFGDRGRIDPDAQARVLNEAAAAAVAAGWSGLRVAGDLTELVRDPGRWEDMRAYEIAADAVVAANPLTGMCGYAVSGLPADRLRPLVALHRIQHYGPFPRFAASVRDGVVALAGEIDCDSAHDLGQVLVGVHERARGPVTVDLQALDFLDVSGTRELVRFAELMQATGRPVHFVRAGRGPRRVLELFDVALS